MLEHRPRYEAPAPKAFTWAPQVVDIHLTINAVIPSVLLLCGLLQGFPQCRFATKPGQANGLSDRGILARDVCLNNERPSNTLFAWAFKVDALRGRGVADQQGPIHFPTDRLTAQDDDSLTIFPHFSHSLYESHSFSMAVSPSHSCSSLDNGSTSRLSH